MELPSRLKAPPQRMGESNEDYLERLFQVNRKAMEDVAASYPPGLRGSRMDPRELLYEEVEGFAVKQGLSLQEATLRYGRSSEFYSREEKAKFNALNAITESDDLHAQFRQMLGNDAELDWTQVQITEESGQYIYGNILIILDNSPLEIILINRYNGSQYIYSPSYEEI